MARRWAVAEERGFKITSQEPSRVAVKLAGFLPDGARVWDIGSRSDRNARFFLRLGFSVDAVDVQDYSAFILDLPDELRHKVSFTQGPATGLPMRPGKYNGVLLSRLLHYLTQNEMGLVFERARLALKPGGYLALSFNATPDVELIRRKYGLDSFAHDLSAVVALLERSGFSVLSVERGAAVTMGVSYRVPAETFDLLAVKAPLGRPKKG